MTGLLVLAGPVLTTLFQYGEFAPEDVLMSRLSLMAYSIGLLGFILVKVLAPGYYSRQDTTTPMKIGVKAVVANMVLNVVFVVPMVIWAIPGAHAGLAAATACSAFINSGLLYRGLRKSGVYRPEKGWWLLWTRVVLANLLMALVLWYGSGEIGQWFAMSAADRLVRLLTWIAVGIGVYFGVLLLSGVRPHQLLPRKSV